MGGFFYEGETKVRPDNYHRIINSGAVATVEEQEKIACAVVTGNWGELNKAVAITQADDLKKIIGTGKGYEVVSQLFAGGASSIVVVRVGDGGTAGSLTLKDSTSKDAVKLTAKYAGTRALAVTVKASLSDDTVTEVTLYDGSTKLESYNLKAGSDEPEQLVEAMATSSYVTAVLQAEPGDKLEVVAQATFTGGAEPTVNTEAYSTALLAAETENWNCIVVDTDDTAVHAVLAAFVDRIYADGAYPVAVVAEPKTVTLENRMAHAKAFDDEKIIYVLNGWEDGDGKAYEGYLASARIAGIYCATSAAESMTHKTIVGASTVVEPMTGAQIIDAIKAGCMVISISKVSKVVRIEKGINTLNTLGDNQDEGWKKTRRVMTRFELMQRVDQATDDLNGTVNNDDNGRAAVMAAVQSVMDAMVGENKLREGATITLDESNPPAGDAAWFIINADDNDSYEIGYFTYGFRFTQAAE